MLKVYVDDRERDNVINKGRKFFDVVVKHLPVGDVVYQDLCVERKTISDFINSVQNGRVFHQASNMAKNYRKNWVIIIGTQTQAAFDKCTRFSVDQYLASIASLEQIVSVKHVDNETQFWKLCKYLFEKSTDGKNRIIENPQRIERSTGDVFVDQLSQVPKIGPKKAKTIIETFELTDLHPLYHMTVDDLMSVRGIGEKQAKTIKVYFPTPKG